MFYLKDGAGRPSQWRPFVQGGLGFAYLEKDGRAPPNADTGFLVNVGGGVEAHVYDDFTLSSSLMVNWFPDDVVGEDVFLSWQILQIGFRF